MILHKTKRLHNEGVLFVSIHKSAAGCYNLNMELLAPCGNRESFFAAVNHGADAVYIGLPAFSARQSAQCFTLEELKELFSYARAFGVKVYVAANTLVKDNELSAFLHAVADIYETGADALILQDIFLANPIKQICPDIVLHASTQAGMHNREGAEIAKSLGFSRVIPARETPLCDIAEISAVIETEAFVQGALCTAFSGQCYLSSFAGGNSGNRGRCKQPCRRLYEWESGGQCYALSPSDLSVGVRIKEYQAAGVSSLKIEGRMRRAEYVAAAVRYYRALLDGETADLSALKRTYNRGGYTSGLAFGQDANFLSAAVQGHIGEKVGTVQSVSGRFIKVKGNYAPSAGDGFKILRNGAEAGSASCVKTQTPASTFELAGGGDILIGDDVHVTTDTALGVRLLSVTKTVATEVTFTAHESALAVATASANGKTVAVQTDEPLVSAKTNPLTSNEAELCFQKTGGTPFSVSKFTADIGNVFIAKSQLNELRRRLYDALYAELSAAPSRSAERTCITDFIKKPEKTKPQKNVTVIAADFGELKNLRVGNIVFAPADYNDNKLFQKFNDDTNGMNAVRYLYLPPFLNSKDKRIAERQINMFDGIYCDGIYGAALAKEWNKKFFAGIGCNVFNSVALQGIRELGADNVMLSQELNAAELAALDDGKAYVLDFGALKVMNLIYCPFGKKCGGCKISGISTLTDFDGRRFNVRKIMLSDCRFEIFNNAVLRRQHYNGNVLLNFTGLNDDVISAFLKDGDIGNYVQVTNGHFKRGVE